jgi:hypothetical protein
MDGARQATLLQAFEAAEQDSSEEGLREFAVYCEQYYAPEEIQQTRITALVTKLLKLLNAGITVDAMKVEYFEYLQKFRYTELERAEAERRYRMEKTYFTQAAPLVHQPAQPAPVLYETPVVMTTVMDNERDPCRIGYGMAATFCELGATCEFIEPPTHSYHSRVMQFRFRPGKGVDVNTFKTKIDNLIVRNNLLKRPVIRLIPGFMRSRC